MIIAPKEAIPQVIEKTCPQDFFIPAHQTIRRELIALWEAGTAIDLITLTGHLRDKKLLDAVGGAAFVTSLFTCVPSAANLSYYLNAVIAKSIQRRIIEAGESAASKAHEEQEDVPALLADVQLSIASIKFGVKEKPKTLHEHFLDKIERMESSEPDADIIFTRIKELDRLSPLRMGDMPVISGKRKSGKSIIALSILENVCISQSKPGLYFSLEDRIPKVVDRIFAGVSRIPMNRHHVKKMSEAEVAASSKATEKMASVRMMIRDSIFDLHLIISEAKKVLVEFPDLALIVIDYGQLVRVHAKKGASREQEVATVSRALRLFSMETGVPIIVLSQENAAGNTRESTALEQDCTALWQIREVPNEPRRRKLDIPCQRNGESGVFFELCFLGEIARAENLHRPHDLVSE